MHDEANDEMSSYFNREIPPKVVITTSPYAKVVSSTRFSLVPAKLFFVLHILTLNYKN